MKIHPTADVQSNAIGEGTTVWQGCVILPGARIGRDCNVNAFCLVEGGASLGDRVTLKCGVYVWDGVELADGVFVGPNATFTNDPWPRSKRRPSDFARTRVGRGASIGAAATLVAPIDIGEYALIGAGALVTKDVPSHALMVGSPARRVGWVCRCGSRLPHSLACDDCGLVYEQSSVGLAVKPGHDK
jgi:UDP-2-acetamido-3-amino-2,3-dideoxy-glucuronate N-acetyltransferase